MPRSKSKRKSVLQRERSKAHRENTGNAAERHSVVHGNIEIKQHYAAYDRLHDSYAKPFHKENFDDDHAGAIVDMLVDFCFSWTGGNDFTIVPFDEASLLTEFCKLSMDPFPESPNGMFTMDMGEAALLRLVKLGKIERIDGLVRPIIPHAP